jgi:hypothetical protein
VGNISRVLIVESVLRDLTIAMISNLACLGKKVQSGIVTIKFEIIVMPE